MRKMYLLKKWLMCHAEFISASKIEILKQVQNDIIFRRYKKLLSILLLSFLFILISLYVYAVPNSPTVLKIEGKNVIPRQIFPAIMLVVRTRTDVINNVTLHKDA